MAFLEQWSAPRRRVAVMVVIAVVLVIAIVIALQARKAPAPTPTADVKATSHVDRFQPSAEQWASFNVQPVGRAAFDALLTVDGTIVVDDNASASVYSQYSGRVTQILAQPGQVVRQGAPLVALLATESAQARSDLAAAMATEASTRKQFELAQANETRQHELFLAEAAAEKDWLQSKSDLVAADSAHRAAEAALAAAREKGAVLGDGAHPGTITSPIDGIVVQRAVQPGQYINSLSTGGSTPLFVISDLRRVWVVATVGEIDAAKLKVGLPVDVQTLALAGRTVRAKITWIGAVVDPSTHRVPFRAELANPDLALKPQMTATVRVLQDAPVQALAVPRGAVVVEGDEAHVWVATPDRALVVRRVTLGRTQGDRVEVKAGLAEGDQVVTRGTLFIDRAVESEGA